MEDLNTTAGSLTLAELRDDSILATDQGTSSDDESPASEDVEADKAREAVGVSIGYQQSRLTSPTTPAVEKAAALDKAGGFFAGAFDGSASGIADTVLERDDEDEDDNDDTADDVSGLHGMQSRRISSSPRDTHQQRLPSPWRAGPKQFQRNSKTRSVLRDGFSFGRRRSSSGPESIQKSFFATFPSMPSMPSMPKDFSFRSPFSSSRQALEGDDRDYEHITASKGTFTPGSASMNPAQSHSPANGMENRTLSASHSPQTIATRSRKETEEMQATVGNLPKDLQLRHTSTRSPILRRSTSDGSLVTQRTLSHVPSLGDDSRFESVHDQVNSRFKAIKDSFADSSIKLPSMPSIPNFYVPGNFLNRDRSGSLISRLASEDTSAASLHERKYSGRPVDPITRQPYASARAAISDTPLSKASVTHPHFAEALDQLEGDIVVLGGYRGSILRSAEPPHRQLWVPIKVGLNLRKADLEVGILEEDDNRPSEKVIPGGMLTHIGPVDMSRRLLKRLRDCENVRTGKLRVHEYGYDWRLHPAFLSKQIISFLEKLPCNQTNVGRENRGALVVAHSLGGLIVRHAVNQRPELFAGVVYAGVPKTCVNILGPLRNGDEVLLSSRVLTAQVNFTIRTSFALLPLNGRCFFDKDTKEEYAVDFFDPQTWIDYRLSPCVARPLPPLVAAPKPSGITGYMSSMASVLPSLSLPGRKTSDSKTKASVDLAAPTMAGGAEASETSQSESRIAAASGNIAKPGQTGNDEDDTDLGPPSARTAVTIPRREAIEYLTRTLRTVKKFKEELAFNPTHHASNVYPPISVIYGKTTPTVFGAKVHGREGIKHADAYDDLAFASGDGVVLSKAAMVPEGYRTARGGIVSSDRGHVTLLGDLEAVGKCISAVVRARKRGIGVPV